MIEYRNIAVKLARYFEHHKNDHPQWESALNLSLDWLGALDGRDHDKYSIHDRASRLDASGTAVDELKIMIRQWCEETKK